MDIQVSSNFERLLFDLHGRDGAALAGAMRGFDTDRRLALTPAMRGETAHLFASARVDATAMEGAMRRAHDGSAMLLDPHTAIGLAAVDQVPLPPETPVVVLATAHPAKFPDAVERATGVRPPLPTRVGDLFEREERYDVLPATLDAVEAYVAARAVPRA